MTEKQKRDIPPKLREVIVEDVGEAKQLDQQLFELFSLAPMDLQIKTPEQCVQEFIGRRSEETASGTTHYTHYRIGRHPGDTIQIATRQQRLSNDHGP